MPRAIPPSLFLDLQNLLLQSYRASGYVEQQRHHPDAKVIVVRRQKIRPQVPCNRQIVSKLLHKLLSVKLSLEVAEVSRVMLRTRKSSQSLF